MSSEDPYAVPANHSDTNLYLRGVPPHIDDTELRRLFEAHGALVSVMVMRDIHTGESLGTAFVRYTAHASALAAMKHFCPNPMLSLRGGSKAATTSATPKSTGSGDTAPIPGLTIQWARKQHDEALVGEARTAARKLFLRNIPNDVDGKMLFELVKPYGLVDQVTLHVDTADANGNNSQGGFISLTPKSSNGTNNNDPMQPPLVPMSGTDQRLIAFVTFSEDGAAAAACDALHNTMPFRNHGGVPIMAKLAEDTRQRTARRTGGHAPGSPGSAARGGGATRPVLSATSTAHGGRGGAGSGFSSYHAQAQNRPTGFSTYHEMETNIYPSPVQAVAYSQHQPLSAVRNDVYTKSIPMSANQQYYGVNYSADMIVPPRPPTVPLSSSTAQNYYSSPYSVVPQPPAQCGAPFGAPPTMAPHPLSAVDLDTLSQRQSSHYEPSNTDTASSNSRFRHNPYSNVEPHTLL